MGCIAVTNSDKLLSKVKMLYSQTLNHLNTELSVVLTCLEEDAFYIHEGNQLYIRNLLHNPKSLLGYLNAFGGF